MKRRSALKKKPAGNRKKKHPFALFKAIHRAGAGIIKVFFLFTVVFLISVGFLSFYHYLLTSPYMRLQQVEAEGVDEKIRKELIRTSGLHSDLSLLELNLNELKEKMQKHPWVRSVNLERRFPHTLVVKAEKETAWALVVMDKTHYMNRWGEVFKEVEDSENIDFPVITGVSKQGSEVRKQLEKAVRVMKALEKEKGQWSLKELSEIHMNENGGMSLYFNCMPAEIKLGSGNLSAKITDLKKVTKHLTQTGRIDLVNGIYLNQVDEAVVSFKKTL